MTVQDRKDIEREYRAACEALRLERQKRDFSPEGHKAYEEAFRRWNRAQRPQEVRK